MKKKLMKPQQLRHQQLKSSENLAPFHPSSQLQLHKNTAFPPFHASNNKSSSSSSSSLQQQSYDAFRFDDKLIGRRTNCIFRKKQNKNGFIDIDFDSVLNSYLDSSENSLVVGDKDGGDRLLKVGRNDSFENEIENGDGMLWNDKDGNEKEKEKEIRVQKIIDFLDRIDMEDLLKNEGFSVDTVKQKQEVGLEMEKRSGIEQSLQVVQRQRSQSIVQEVEPMNDVQNLSLIRPLKVPDEGKDEKTVEKKPQETVVQNILKDQDEKSTKERNRKKDDKKRSVKPGKNKQKFVPKQKKSSVSNQIPSNQGRFQIDHEGDLVFISVELQDSLETGADDSEQSRYPKRLRIPPLRYWENQRRTYEHGRWNGLYLTVDQKGEEVAKMINRQQGRIY